MERCDEQQKNKIERKTNDLIKNMKNLTNWRKLIVEEILV